MLRTVRQPKAHHHESNARIVETLFREELRDGGLATLKARLWLSIARARLLAFVSASGGLAQT